ncbi:acetylornithine deacetylase (ArgE) [Sphingorhabdus lutea]|uniref:Acetylornithine deacetylase (ArgE) n=1 Tax=Sphingorhabdus lutea TaxID=1913578 RepID=A0A1L3JAK7_9SPHN|nr:acetylornithine deacetylase [Sphingorhabdus lutea]APG62165.1 acetylornithine deacetylase (ArgE) [Sphingorhabdus lutea]
MLAQAKDIFKTLIAFDTTSRDSNLAFINWVAEYLHGHGITSHLVHNDIGNKANLYASIGPLVEGGIILSGHSDVVPVDGQDWHSNPFILTEKDGKYFGRGTCDMKAFIALALAAVPMFKLGQRPIHLAISYDEEVGCKGAPAMIAQIADKLPRPAMAIIGEPSMMRVINGHKGIMVHEVNVYGHEAHSSLTHLGLSANMVAVELMHDLAELARTLWENADVESPFMPPHSTLTIGEIQGGTATNILARHCRFAFDLRSPPSDNPSEILAPFFAKCAALDTEMAAAFPNCGIKITQISATPPLSPTANNVAEEFVRSLTGDNEAAIAASYAAEAGQFQAAGFPSVICGPGSIEQAHQPNEFIAVDQFERGAKFMEKLAAALA